MALVKKKDDILYWGLAALVLYMPLHYYLCELLLSGSGLDNILRDLLLIALTALVFFCRERLPVVMTVLVTVSCALLAVMGLISYWIYRLFPILNILRTYLIPMLVYYVAAGVSLTRQRFDLLNRFLVIGLALVAIYGYFQAFFLTDDFLVKLGYASNGEYLKSNSFYISHFFGYQRATGTFVSPNICGIILAVAIIALLYTDPKCDFRYKYIWGTLLVIGLAATFSRSSMVGVAVAVAFSMVMSRAWERLSRRTFRRGVLVVATAVAFLVMDWLVLDSLLLRMFLSTLIRSFNGEDPSANAHLQHLLTPPAATQSTAATVITEATVATAPVVPTVPVATAAPVVPNEPEIRSALRFGLNGPMAEEFLSNPLKVESSFYLMGYELGTVGSIVYFVPYLVLILITVLRRKVYPYFVPAAVSAAVLVSYVFLPNVQTFEVPFYCFLFMGLYCNSSVKELYRQSQ